MRVIVIGVDSASERELYENYIRNNLSYLSVTEVVIDMSSQQVEISVKSGFSEYAKMNGCFISNPDTWNDAKKAEYRDRVFHPIE